ncbi:MAG TPA: sigma-70 family RNA polymerase sigma factor, partial [Burkholderiaceae bacterium]|nr:sigma-70 family RNA polymerase sigma factor [Burkholderiaceae bacterium]
MYSSANESQLIEEHVGLVRRIALQLIARLPANVELDDLLQAGMMGLLDAIRRYQPSDEARFETYASTRIRGAMLDELRSQDWLPRSVRSSARQIETAIQQLQDRLLRQPSEAEIAQELDLSLDDYQAFLASSHGMQVLHYEDFLRQNEGKAG